jgi:hypothetical protein
MDFKKSDMKFHRKKPQKKFKKKFKKKIGGLAAAGLGLGKR